MSETLTFGPIATTDNDAVVCIAANDGVNFEGLHIWNKGSVDGWVSVDSGDNWRLLPAKSYRFIGGLINNQSIQVKRITDGSDLADVYGEFGSRGDYALLESATIQADIINADMNAITGTSPNNKTLYDIHTKLIAAPATEAKQDTIIAGVGALTDEPLAAETAEGATARSGISLWKRAVNKLIDIKALLVKGTAAMASSLAVTLATDDTQLGAVGAAADVDGNIHGQLRYIGESDAAIIAAVASGLPVSGFEATGDDDNNYNTILTAPARECHYCHVAVGNGGVRVSLDGGTTVHFYVPANTERLFPGLVIASGATVQAKKYSDGGTVSTNLAISVW